MNGEISLNPGAHSSAHEHKPLSLLDRVAIAAGAVVLGLLIYHYVGAHAVADASHAAAAPQVETAHGAAAAADHHVPAGYELPPLWACLPFVAILMCIALLPLIPATAHWWESNKNRLAVSLVLAGLTLVYYAFIHPMTYSHETGQAYTGLGSVIHVLEHAVLIEYLPFIVLLFSLYVISGGISLQGDLPARPSTNAAFLGVGASLASFIGTTGASMLLIRPLLQTNRQRRYKVHTVVFFIFLVSNCGGLLLPIGDPPLFLGYLRGVPFLWTLGLFWSWAFVVGLLIVIYFIWDSFAFRREAPMDRERDETQRERLSLSGTHNFLLLVGIVLCVGLVDPSKEMVGGFKPFPFMRELLMMGLVGASLLTTKKSIYQATQFNYHAILEVAALFIGIFICMQVPIEILHEKGGDLGLTKPWQYFWTTGALSSFLDNAPTYVVFFSTASVLPAGADAIALPNGAISSSLLIAISLGAVFMGAMTYIGNGPNFMVKSIAEQSGVRMPSFFGYMLYSVAILVPIFVAVTLIYLR